MSDLDCVYEIVCLNLQAVLSHGSNTSLDLDTSHRLSAVLQFLKTQSVRDRFAVDGGRQSS